MDSAYQVQILDEMICCSGYANALGERRDSIASAPKVDKANFDFTQIGTQRQY